MSDAPNHDDNGQEPEPDHIKKLRAKAGESESAKADAAQARKELAFVKAGIDTDSKPAQALIASYEGELTSDAIKAEATEWGLVKLESQEETPPEAPNYDSNSPEARHQDLREGTHGAPAPNDGPPPKGGVDAAIDSYHDNRKRGMRDQDAQIQAFAEVIKAGAGGDRQAIFDPAAWAEEQERASARLR